MVMWTPRVRTAALALTDPFLFTELILVERDGPPDSLQIVGDTRDLEPAMEAGSGVVVWDDAGNQRFSGRPAPHPDKFLEERGDGTAVLNYRSDLQVLWNRFCYPSPTLAFNAQVAAYDEQTAVHETRVLGYILRNAGSTAYNGTYDRRVSNLRLPTTLGRGTSAKTSARFNNLGQLVADLAEAADLRVTIQQTYEGSTPYLDVVIDDVPDLSEWARFGDARSGDLGMLGQDWSYGIGPGVSLILSAGGEELENRVLNFLHDPAREADWGGDLVEFFLDQRGTTDAGEIAAGMATAMVENAPTSEVQAPIIGGDLEFGTGAGQIPIGSKVSVALGGGVVVDRIRQLTTTVSVAGGDVTVRQEPIVGSPDTGLSIEQRFLRRAGRRLNNLERR